MTKELRVQRLSVVTWQADRVAKGTKLARSGNCVRNLHSQCVEVGVATCECECHRDPDFYRKRGSSMHVPDAARAHRKGTTTVTIEYGIAPPRRGRPAGTQPEWIGLLDQLVEMLADKKHHGEWGVIARYPRPGSGGVHARNLRVFADCFGDERFEIHGGRLDGGSAVWARVIA